MPANLDLFTTKLFHPAKALKYIIQGKKQDDQTHSPHQYFVLPCA